MSNHNHKIGIDVGSTTLKVVVIDENNKIVYKNYVRHKAEINAILLQELKKIKQIQDTDKTNAILSCHSHPTVHCCITGSAGMGVAERVKLPVVQ
jgi:activator of 2-hydroxyglutaryl-CoA dehydratase